jgi:Flp pilus assembly protein TadG
LLLVTLGIFEYGRVVMYRQLMNDAAREGARLAIVGTAVPGTTTQTIVDGVAAIMANARLNNLGIQVFSADPVTGLPAGSWATAAYGQPITVRIDGDYDPCLPTCFGVVPSSIHVRASSTMLSEAN